MDSESRLNLPTAAAISLLALLALALLNACTSPPSTPTVTPLLPSNTPTATPRPTQTPTPAAPPAGTTMLQVVDTSTVSVTLPVHGQLLIKACDKTVYDGPDKMIPCFVGLLNLDDARVVQLFHFEDRRYHPRDSLCLEMTWSPDGRHFVCKQCDIGLFTCGFAVFRADGERQFDGGYIATWSPDGNYLEAITCVGNGLARAYTLSIYDASSWEKVCAISIGNAMVCYTNWGGECELPLADGRVWFTAPNNNYEDWSCFEEKVCDEAGNCTQNYIGLTNQCPFRREYATPSRYQVSIENYWLRVIDTETGSEKAFAIPGYRITNFAWSPE
jgi:hypothetical protein